MLVFLIHGVATQNAGYGDKFKRKVKELLLKASTNREAAAENDIKMPVFYSSFWGHTFKSQTDQINWVRSDIKEITNRHPDLKDKGNDIYRYQELREDFIGKFFGDFLTYIHTEKGAEIRKQILAQFQACVKQHPGNQQVVIAAHSLGTLIVWDLLFAQNLPPADPAYEFRQLFHDESYQLQLHGLVTMGSPLLFMKIKQDIDFSIVDDLYGRNPASYLIWLNLIHASEPIAYPLSGAIKHDCDQPLFLFMDQYIWQFSNLPEFSALGLGQLPAAMALGGMDAHNSYWRNDITAQWVALLLQGDVQTLCSQRVHTG